MRLILLGLVLFTAVTSLAGINEWTFVGLSSEIISDVATQPEEAGIIYAVSFAHLDGTGGGVFKTTDHGMTWDTLGFRHFKVVDVEIDNLTPETIWVVLREDGIYRSTDGGIIWEPRHNGIFLRQEDEFGPYKIAVSAFNSNDLLVGNGSPEGGGACYRSINGGESWAVAGGVWGNPVHFVDFDRHVPGLGYAGVVFLDQAWATNDTGASFHSITDPLFAGLWDLKANPGRTNEVWRTESDGHVYVSANGGETWSPRFVGLSEADTLIVQLALCGSADTLGATTSTQDSDYPRLSFDGGLTSITLSDGLPPVADIQRLWIVSTNPLELWGCNASNGLWSYSYYDTLSINADYPNHFAHSVPPSVTLFPNPNSGSFSLSVLGIEQVSSLQLYDVLGRTICTLELNESRSLVVHLPNSIPTGRYFLSAESKSYPIRLNAIPITIVR